MSRRIMLIVVFILVIAMAFAACAPGEDAAQTQPDSTEASDTASEDTGEDTGGSGEPARDDIVIVNNQEPATLDPNFMGDGAGFIVASNIYDALVWVTDDGKIEPQLAKEWSLSEDGLEYTFKLRDDVTFHNGEPFSAEDVKFTYDRAMESAYAGAVTSLIDSVAIVNDYEVVVKLKNAFAPMMECFGSHFLRIVNKEAVEEAGESFSYNPVGAGTGPYKFVSWTSGEKIVLEANEDYFEGAPAIKNVEFRIVTDSAATAIAIETGEADLGMIGVLDVPTFEDNPDLAVSSASSVIYCYLGFNTQSEYFDDPLVRQAVSYSCDKDELLIVSWEGPEAATVAATPVPPSGFGFNADLEVYPKDIEKAKELLAEAGYPDGFETTIYVGEQPFRKNIATYMQACLAEIGITVNIEVMEHAALLDLIRTGGTEMFIMGFSGISADADFFLYNNYHTGTSYNYTTYSNPELDALLEQARVEQDVTKRAELYKQISQIVYDEVPDMPNYFVNWMYGYNSKLNYKTSPFLRVYVYDMSWES